MTVYASIFALLFSANLIDSADFSKDTWSTNSPACTLENGLPTVTVDPDDPIEFPGWYQEFTVPPGTIIEATVEGFTPGTRRGYGAYCSVSWYDEDNQRIQFDQSGPVTVQDTWSPLLVRSAAPAGTVKGRLFLLLNGRGKAQFRNPAVRVLQAAQPIPTTKHIKLDVANKPLPQPLWGFGFEDDGWFYNELNKEKGADAEAIRIREQNIQHLDPDWVRMFFWYRDWNPSGDLKTFPFDSDNMLSHYKSLELYQELGAEVTVTGVEWAVKAPFNPPEQLAFALGELLEELIVRRGFTCIKHWILTNEPNVSFHQHGGTFQDYVDIHRLVREEFKRRKLDVKILGSDDTNGGLNWFKQCVNSSQYSDLCDAYVSHRYLKKDALPLAQFFYEDRLQAMAQAGEQDKSLLIAEFGFQDARSNTTQNPLMQEYDYALWTMAFVCEGLNRGASGFNIWCLQEMYYPGGKKMNYGLWDFGGDWPVRPVFNAWALLGQHTKQGDPIYPVESPHPALKAIVIRDTLFLVNLSDEAIQVEVPGLNINYREFFMPLEDAPKHSYLLAQGIMHQWVPVKDSPIHTVPPNSFGRLFHQDSGK